MPGKVSESAIADFIQSVGLLVRRVRAAAASHELSLTESAVMARLAKDGAATVADLARAESMKPQSMGTTVSALQEAGLVERTPHATDGRQFNIALARARKGAAVRKSAGDAKRTWLSQAIAQLWMRMNSRLCFALVRLSGVWWIKGDMCGFDEIRRSLCVGRD